ncbi:MAG: hypothetical protein BGO54_05280 [Sphingobacteriales bacterium 46-32]|nr:MAG: hypothetical protein BGO54_05280 [Sphingobacteriales bacterium 46-32]
MARNGLFTEGDFVRYTGDYAVVAGALREPGIGRIEEFQVLNGVEKIYLFLHDRNEHIWCDYDKIRCIETEEKHLLACGYTVEMAEQRKRYRRGGSVISSGLLYIHPLRQWILTGYCVTDFTGVVALDKYLHDPTRFDIHLFYQDFPGVNNLNDLFDYLNGLHLQLNWEAIANL